MMVRRRPGETDRAYVDRLRDIIAAAQSPAEVPTPEEEIRRASLIVEKGAAYGYMAGRRLDDYRRVEAIAANLGMARAFGVTDLAARTVDAVTAAETIAETWRGREE